MVAKNYKYLSKIYDIDWGKFALNYVTMINRILVERKIAKAKILDLACGTGNLAIALARSGHAVKGFDISPEMIQVAIKKSVHEQYVSFKVEDMTKFSVKDRYNVITCTFDSINYLMEVDDVKAMVANVFCTLDDSGVFIFDFNTEYHYLNRHKGVYQKEIDGIKFIQRAIYGPEEKIAITEFEFPNEEREIHHQRPYCLSEIKDILEEEGFILSSVFSGFDARMATSESERVICVAEKSELKKLH